MYIKKDYYNSVLFLTIIILMILSGCNQKDITGQYEGTCENQTYDIKAKISLTINEDKGIISGNLTLAESLEGSGNIQGQLNGSIITFTTDGSWGQVTWTGTLKDKTIEGTYLFDDGFNSQKGVWFVQKQ